MKKLMLVMGLLGIVVFSHAAEREIDKPGKFGVGKQHYEQYKIAPPIVTVAQVPECSMSATVSASIGVFRVEGTCTASGPTCDEAAGLALSCATSFIKRLIGIMK